MKSLVLNNRLRLPALVTLSLTYCLCAWGQASMGTASNPIPCSFRLSAQVYLEQSDFVELGALTLALIKDAESTNT